MSTSPGHTPTPEGGPAEPEVPDTAEDQIAYLIDPGWRPTPGQPDPGPAQVVGAWILRADGGIEGFQSNPDYVPSDPGSPTDPVDAVLQILALDREDGLRPEDETMELLDTVLVEARLGVALDENGVAVVRAAPGGGSSPSSPPPRTATGSPASRPGARPPPRSWPPLSPPRVSTSWSTPTRPPLR